MEEKELKKIIARVLKDLGCKDYSFGQYEGGYPGFRVSFSLPKEDALRAYEELTNVNLYGVGWLMRDLAASGEEFKITFEKV